MNDPMWFCMGEMRGILISSLLAVRLTDSAGTTILTRTRVTVVNNITAGISSVAKRPTLLELTVHAGMG